MDYDDLFRLLPKAPKKWSTQEVLVWLKFIGYSQLDTYFINECVDGSCLEILTDQDLLDMGIVSPLQRKKLLQWISLGLKEFTNYCKTHQPVTQSFAQINQPLQQEYIKQRVPLETVHQNIQQSKHEFDIEIDEHIIMGSIPVEPQPSPGGRQKQLFLMPNTNPTEKITEGQLAQQVQQSNKKNIFAELQIPQITKPIFQSPQKTNNDEQEYHLPHFGTPKFDKTYSQQVQNLTQQEYSQLIIKVLKDGNSFTKTITKNATIGRNPENDIQLNQESVSRTHIWINLKENVFYLQDRGSLIGTFILLESRTQLLQNYIIQMGSTEIIIQQLQTANQQCNVVMATQMGVVQIALEMNKPKIIGSQTFGDSTMQKEHAIIQYSQEGISIEDCKSQTGTWLRLSKSGVQSQVLPINRKRVIKISDFVLILDFKN